MAVAPSWQLMRAADGAIVVSQLEVAASFAARLVGLQFRRRLPLGHGLIIIPCRAIHTCFIRFNLSIFGIDRTGRVTSHIVSLPPWRVWNATPETHAILELAAGDYPLAPGDTLELAGDVAVAPAALSFLPRHRGPQSST